jgi:hypothetical protein
VLAAAGAGLGAGALAGCSLLQSSPAPPPPDPLEPLLRSTRLLVARYAAALAAHPDLAERLGDPHQAHLAHEAALLDVINRPELASPSPGGAAWASPSEAVPTAPDDAIAALRDAERDGRDEAVQACLSAPPARAPLLGSIAAARATHVEVLR